MGDLNMTARDKAASQSLKERIADTGAEVKQRASDALRGSTEAARENLKEAANTAKDVASDAADRVQEQMRQKQHAGADYVGRVAQNMRSAARAFEHDTPFTARGITTAADYVDEAARKLRSGTFRDVAEGAADFARRQPAAFLGLSVLAGFAVIRFLKASGDASSNTQGDAR